ncbi:MAG: MBOAT family O-acyltransferase [Polyangiaceae bacterium]
MLFNSPLYGAFLLVTFVVFWAIRKHRLARVVFLTLASYGFYFYGTYDTANEQGAPLGPFGWAILCLGIIFVGSTLDFWIGRALGKVEKPSLRKALLLLSVVYYLGVLAIFKYWDFAMETVRLVLARFGIHTDVAPLNLVLPFGISFFTFETMSYTIDVYRRELEPAKKYLDYLLFVCFFPHLVAGPIVRPKDMLPQFAKTPVANPTQQGEGLWLIATGLLKKVVIGDLLARTLVNDVFKNPDTYTSMEVLVGVYAYAFQIYADFSGYTDVALGSAKLFGYELPTNFDAPYTAKDLQEFWQRWHISLSTWLRDYLYKPLGGSRGSSLLTYRNLLLTMVLGGLWHGASWNFVIWGTLHGLALAVTRMWQRARGTRSPTGVARVVTVFLTFNFVCFCWVFFRAKTFGGATAILARIADHTTGLSNVPREAAVALLCAAALHFVPRTIEERARRAFVTTPSVVQGVVLACALYGLHWVSKGTAPEPFVYGQF